MKVKCKYCGNVLDKNDSVLVQGKAERDNNGYYCFCSKKCLIKSMIDEFMEE